MLLVSIAGIIQLIATVMVVILLLTPDKSKHPKEITNYEKETLVTKSKLAELELEEARIKYRANLFKDIEDSLTVIITDDVMYNIITDDKSDIKAENIADRAVKTYLLSQNLNGTASNVVNNIKVSHEDIGILDYESYDENVIIEYVKTHDTTNFDKIEILNIKHIDWFDNEPDNISMHMKSFTVEYAAHYYDEPHAIKLANLTYEFFIAHVTQIALILSINAINVRKN
jgi:hypothetical protein